MANNKPKWRPTKRIFCEICKRIVFSKTNTCFKCGELKKW